MYGKPTPKYAKTIGLVSLPRQLTYMYTIIKIYLIFSIYLYKSFFFFFWGGGGGKREFFVTPKFAEMNDSHFDEQISFQMGGKSPPVRTLISPRGLDSRKR